LDLLGSVQHQGWKSLVTLDEAWFYFSNQHKQIWLPDQEDPPTIQQQTITSLKTMLAVVWTPHGFHLVSLLPKGQKWTSQSYIDHILPEICALRDARDRRKVVVHADNARPHVAKRVNQYLEDNNLKSAPHPPYSPDLAPNNFFLFGHVKRLLQGTEFQTAEELFDAVVRILADIPLETLMATFHKWLQRLQAFIDRDGEYVESTFFDSKNFSRISTGN
jgi:transposase